MTGFVLPVIGSRGFFELASPFDRRVANRVQYTTQSIRRLSECIANNEDPWRDIYQVNDIEEAIYREDVEQNAYIVSLQSDRGQWLHVPYRYVLSYPSVEGVPYRSLMMGISLPALPVEQDITGLIKDLKAFVESRLGVSTVIKPVETSQVVLIKAERHQASLVEREYRKSIHQTLYSRNLELQQQLELTQAKLAALEAYILENE